MPICRRVTRRDRKGAEIKKGSKNYHVTFRDQIPTEDFALENSELFAITPDELNDINESQKIIRIVLPFYDKDDVIT